MRYCQSCIRVSCQRIRIVREIFKDLFVFRIYRIHQILKGLGIDGIGHQNDQILIRRQRIHSIVTDTDIRFMLKTIISDRYCDQCDCQNSSNYTGNDPGKAKKPFLFEKYCNRNTYYGYRDP